MGEAAVHVTDSTFESEVLKSELPVLVDFWAPWCGPCRMIAPTIEAVAKDNIGKLKVCKVNVDENQEVAAKYGIRGIPTIILFKDGRIINQIVGAAPREKIDEMLENVL